MPKRADVLSALEIKNLTEPGSYAVGTVPGLYIRVGTGDGKSWVLRYMDGTRRAEKGLGAYPEVPLKRAIEIAREIRDSLKRGQKPLISRGKRKSLGVVTFEYAAKECVLRKRHEWKSAQQERIWVSSLTQHVFPLLGKKPVDIIDRAAVLNVLEPIWLTKTETASRIRQRIEIILDFAKGMEWRSGDNPAAWRGSLQGLLPEPKRIASVKHHPALDWHDAPSFIAKLRDIDSLAARCIEFTMLTAVRPAEARQAEWSEFNEELTLWTVPAARMKGRKTTSKTHEVPLSRSVTALLRGLPRIAGNDFLFPSPQANKALSDVSINKVLHRLVEGEATIHGMRSTFSTWAGECSTAPREVREASLAHSVNKTEGAYRREDFVAKRAKLMQEWDDFLNSNSAKVIQMPIETLVTKVNKR